MQVGGGLVEVVGGGCGLAGGQVIPTRSTLLYTLVSAATTRVSGVGGQLTDSSVIWQVAPQVRFFGGRSDVKRGLPLADWPGTPPPQQVSVSAIEQLNYF